MTAAVRELVLWFAHDACEGRELSDDTPLDGRGVGLDSVARVELLLECEQEFDVRFAQSLLDEGGLTIRHIAACVREARGDVAAG